MSESHPIKILVSSTREDLMPYRVRAHQVIEKLRLEHQAKWQIIPVAMETAVQTGMREAPVCLSKEWVEESDWVVLIVAWHYGTISIEDGAKGIAVTEWEFQHAVSLNKRPIFVFLSGEPRTPAAYRPSSDEPNLMDWLALDSQEDKEKITKFRDQLAQGVVDYFKDINDFAAQLERSLQKAILEKVPPIPRTGALARVIRRARPEFKACIKSVRTLVICKDIHDALHILRQEVIKRVSGEILDLWRSQGSLSRGTERKLTALRISAGHLLSEIKSARNKLDGSRAVYLLECIGKLLNAEDLLNPIVDSDEGGNLELEDFAERVDVFSQHVHRSFSQANQDMNEEKVTFNKLHDALRDRLDDARSKENLTDDELATLIEETAKMRQNKTSLIDAVTLHGAWQEIHDQMEEYQDSSEKKLRQFVNFYGTKLRGLVVAGLGPLKRGEAADADIQGTLQRVERAMEDLQARPGCDLFDQVRDDFDLCFFEIDNRTKALLEMILNRVDDFDAVLDKLDQPSANGGQIAGVEDVRS